MTNKTQASLSDKLELLVQRGSQHLQSLARRTAIERILVLWPKTLLIVASLSLLVVLASKFSTFVQLGNNQLIALTIMALVGCALVIFAVQLVNYKIKRQVALSYFDRTFDLQDRLQTADEYSKKTELNSFEMAALNDAKPHVEQSLTRDLPDVELTPARYDLLSFKQVLAGVGIFFLSLWVNATDMNLPHLFNIEESIGAGGGQADLVSIEQEQDLLEQTSVSQGSKHSAVLASTSDSSLTQSQTQSTSVTSTSDKSDAASSQGQSSQASGSSSQGGSGGEGSSSKGTSDKPQGKKSTSKPTASANTTEQQPESSEQTSSVNSGSGSSTGENSSSSDNNQAQDKAQDDAGSESDNEESGEQEQDEEEQKAGEGASQLPKNARKSPVNRSLSISTPGDQESEDANGRGGPGGLKKTRGVASMLLAVPLPDRLVGMNNPGRTKSVQSKSTPTEAVVGNVEAKLRGANSNSTGLLPTSEIYPQNQILIRDYFLSQRTESNEK